LGLSEFSRKKENEVIVLRGKGIYGVVLQLMFYDFLKFFKIKFFIFQIILM
jgi:hypothetical protein